MFKQKKSGLLMGFLTMLILSSCVTYDGPFDYVKYPVPKNAKKSIQKVYRNGAMLTRYEDELFFNKSGELIRLKQIEYFDNKTKNRQYVVWETEWKIIGGERVPYRASCNGIVFCSIGWKILPSQNKGNVKVDIEKRFYRKTTTKLLSTVYEFWRANLSSYSIPFNADEKYVKMLYSYGSYGRNEITALSPGYNNIVLSKYHYSYEKLIEGISKTYSGWSMFWAQAKNYTIGSEINFNYTWRVIADRPCMTKLDFKANISRKVSDFSVVVKYNGRGKRTSEDWIVHRPGKKGDLTVFSQSIDY